MCISGAIPTFAWACRTPTLKSPLRKEGEDKLASPRCKVCPRASGNRMVILKQAKTLVPKNLTCRIISPMNISREEFDYYVCQAIESIDPQFRIYLNEVPVIVEDLPDDVVCQRMKLHDRDLLLGLFRGVPLNKQSVAASGIINQIVLYRENILACCRTHTQLVRQIHKTIIHELGHYLGFSEQQLRHHRY